MLIRLVLIILLSISSSLLKAQAKDLSHTPVYMHYMPWFEAPDENNRSGWGYHWTMANADPKIIDAEGNRQIASHYYPLIGPYNSSNTAVIEYHLLLMKHAGIDGLVIDWYGVKGGNRDIEMLHSHTEGIIRVAEKLDMPFCVMVEDNFWRDTTDAIASLKYADENLLILNNYLKGPDNRPYLPVFGPSKITCNTFWERLGNFKDPPQLITLLGKQQETLIEADGSFCWVYEGNLEPLHAFYQSPKKTGKVKWGSAYARFHDYYKEGGVKNSLFNINDSAGYWLKQTLLLAAQYSDQIDAVQLITFNDFGEGTVLEPTKEFGFRDLCMIAQFTLNNPDSSVYNLIYRNYLTQAENKLNFRQRSRYKRIVKLLSNFRVKKATKLLLTTEGEINDVY